MLEQGAYFYGLVAEKRAHPGDDMLSRLIQVEVDRGDGETTSLDDVEIAGFAALLGGAGAETVTKLVGNAVVLFARNPTSGKSARRPGRTIPAGGRGDPALLAAVPVSGAVLCPDDRPMHGVTIPAGYPVMLVTGAAQPTTSAFTPARRLRHPTAAPVWPSASATASTVAWARPWPGMESRIAIAELARRWPRYEIDEAGLRRVQMANVAGYSNVPVHVPADPALR